MNEGAKNKKTKLCKYCKTEIDAGAKICPNCKKKQPGKGKFVAIAVVVIFILAAAFGGKNDDTSTADTSTDSTKSESSKDDTAVKETEKPIEYTAYDVSELMNDLSSNALKAEKKYTDQYVKITGKLSVIDSDGKYISLTPADDEFAILGVQCYIKSDEQTEKVMDMSIGDTVTVKGKITSVGEVMGYALDIDKIK